jgi:hypothetical protein
MTGGVAAHLLRLRAFFVSAPSSSRRHTGLRTTRRHAGLRAVVAAAVALVASAQTPLCSFTFDDAAAQAFPTSGALASACYLRLDGTAGWQPSVVGSDGTGSAIVFSNFGTPVVATQNGTVGISFCLNHTLGFTPTEFR